MDNYLIAIILSVIEGVTEFLPVSSSGHMILAGKLLGFTGEKAATFEVVIQLGAIMAVVILYWPRFIGLLKKNPAEKFSGARGIFLLLLTTLPASIAGLLFHSWIKANFFSTQSVLAALVGGSLCMILVVWLHPPFKFDNINQVTPLMSLGVGLAQCAALWAGFSRSASTIMGGMLLGMNRQLAAEYSFIAAVPIMVGATGYDLLKSWHLFGSEDILFFSLGMIGAFLSALAAIKIFVKLLGRVTLMPFAIYRLALAGLFWFFLLD